MAKTTSTALALILALAAAPLAAQTTEEAPKTEEGAAAALRKGRPCRLSADLSLHVTDVALAIHHARRDGAVRRITTRFPPIEPMPWAL